MAKWKKHYEDLLNTETIMQDQGQETTDRNNCCETPIRIN